MYTEWKKREQAFAHGGTLYKKYTNAEYIFGT